MNNKKRVCKFPEDGTGIKSLYFSGMNLYFLLDSPKELPFKKTIRRYGAEDTELTVHSKESIPLTDKLKIEQWVVDGANIGSLMMDTKICSPAFPIAFGTDTKLIEIFSSSSTNKTITLKQDISTPVVLVLYGDDIKWTIEGDLSKTVGVYVHGLSTVSLPTASGVSVFTDKTSVYPDPKGSSFNAYTWSTIGLGIDSIIDVGQNIMTVLTDKAINDNKLSPKKRAFPQRVINQ